MHFDRHHGTYEVTVYQVGRALELGAQAFDADTFDGFHVYDRDFSFSAHLAGLQLAVCNDILLAHDSGGNFGERYRHYAERFARKRAQHLESVQPGHDRLIATLRYGVRDKAAEFCATHLTLVCADDPLALLSQADASAPAHDHLQTVWWSHLDVAATDSSEYHDSGNHGLLELIGTATTTSLEFGCGAGGLGERIKQIYPAARVFGVELNRAAAQRARQRMDGVWNGRIEDFDPAAFALAPGSVDLLLLGDVLEHLYDPWRIMLRLRSLLAKQAQVLTSVPNVRNMALLAETAEGDWSYQSADLMDITHIRFFTLREMRRLLAQTGYEVKRVEPVLDERLTSLYEQHRTAADGISASLGRVKVGGMTASEFRELCSIQFRISAQPRSELLDTFSGRHRCVFAR